MLLCSDFRTLSGWLQRLVAIWAWTAHSAEIQVRHALQASIGGQTLLGGQPPHHQHHLAVVQGRLIGCGNEVHSAAESGQTSFSNVDWRGDCS